MTETTTENIDTKIISMSWTVGDILDIADELGIDHATAIERAESWARAITGTACELVSEQLYSVIEFDIP